MANKCVVDENALSSFRNSVYEMALSYSWEDIDRATFINQMTLYVNHEIKDKYTISSELIKQSIADLIMKSAVEDAGAEDPTFLTADNIMSLLSSEVSSENAVKNDIQNVLADTVENRVTNFDDTIDRLYGSAFEVKRFVIKEANKLIINAMFIDRGLLSQDNIGVVTSTEQLNRNIRRYQEYLFQEVCKNLDSERLPQEYQDIIANPHLYDSEGNSTGLYDKIALIAERQFGPQRFGPDTLRAYYAMKMDGLNSRLIDGFNAWNILHHFDSYLISLFGDCIEIRNRGKLGGDKYQISNKLAALSKTWRTDENFDPGKEIDKITKLLIETTPVYRVDSSEQIKDRYLTLLNFLHIIAKIKEIAYQSEAMTTVFNEYTGRLSSRSYSVQHPTVWNSLSQETKSFITNKSLLEVISSIRQNPRLNLHYVFELLSNSEFLKTVPSIFNNNTFIAEELNYLYTLNKAIFDPNERTSIKSLVGKHPDIDYYEYITLTSDSIFKNSFIQYYVDDNGVLRTRMLTDLALYNTLRKIISDINTNNSNKLNLNYDLIRGRDLEIQPHYDKYEIEFKIPNTNFKVVVNYRTLGYTIYSDGNPLKETDLYVDKSPNNLITNNNITRFLDLVLMLNLTENLEFFETFTEHYSPKNRARSTDALLKLASIVVANQYISVKELNGNPEYIKSKMDTFFIKGSLDFNRLLNQVNLVPDKDPSIGVILKNLALTRNTLDGITTSTQVKDSQQDALNLQSLSRLLGSWLSLVSLIEKQADSATRELTLINTPGLFKGHFTTSEFYNRSELQNKKARKFSVGEMTYANIVANFLDGLYYTGNGLISDNNVAFLASVNSDKGTIGQLLFDLNTKINDISIINMDNGLILDNIAKDFGTMYSRIYSGIKNNYSELSELIKQFYPDAPSLIYINNFSEFNNWCISRDLDPVQIVKETVKKYNQIHRLAPLELIDNIHYKISKQKVAGKTYNILNNSNTLISQIARFSPNILLQDNPLFNLSEYPDMILFFVSKSAEMLRSLIDSGFELDTLRGYTNDGISESWKSPTFEHLRNDYSDWVNQSGKMILAKMTIGDKVFNIASRADILSAIQYAQSNQEDIYKFPIKLHPRLSQYNLLDYWLTQSWMNTTVGSFISHPAKGKTAIQQEASLYQALHKRNVSMTAQMHEFMINSLKGITEDYTIAVVDDLKDSQSILGRVNAEITPYDGATIVNPFNVYLENNSLAGAKAGFDKKQFIHFKNGKFGNGGIIKTAGFGITNDRLRNSPDGWYPMMRKMTNFEWLNEDGSLFIGNENVNLTKKFDGSNIIYDNCFYRTNDGKYHKITSFKWIVDNLYSIITEEVNQEGEGLGIFNTTELNIDSNYKLWKVLGGEWSMQLDRNSKTLVPSENSISKVVDVMNSMGLIKENYTIDDVETLELLWQPMKHSDINYIVTKGAIKHGSANINENSKYFDNEDLDIQRIKMYQAGIQLDKEHHADDAELSLPTQIISACSLLGYTLDIADQLYNSLAYRADVSLSNLQELVNNYKENNTQENKDALQGEVLKLVAKALSTDNSESFAKVIAKEAILNMDNSNTASYKDLDLPLSDNTVFNKMISTITSILSKLGIKLKIPGVLAVLTPSYNLFKLYGDSKYDSLVNQNVELELMQLEKDANPIYSSNTTIPIFLKLGNDIVNVNQFLTPTADDVETEFVIKSRRDDPSRTNNAIRVYLKGQKERGYFEIVKDDEDGFYSIHFKPTDSNNPNAFTLKEKDILFKACADIIPTGAYLSTWGTISKEGINDLNRFFEETFKKVGSRVIGLKYNSLNNNISNLELGRTYKVIYNENNEDFVVEEPQFDINGLRTGTYKGYPLTFRNELSVVEWDGESINIDINLANTEFNNQQPDENGQVRFLTVNELINYYLTKLHTQLSFKQRVNESDNEYGTRLDTELANELLRRNNPETSGNLKYLEINTVDDYRKLKRDIAEGKVKKVIEYVKVGRNLGAYNVRFTVDDGSRYQLWDIVSVELLLNLQTLKEKGYTPEELTALLNEYGLSYIEGVTINNWIASARRRVQHDLELLSNSVESLIDLFDRLVANKDSVGLNSWLKLNLTTDQYNQVGTNLNKARLFILENSQIAVRNINGQIVRHNVDKTSLDIKAYEAIMPKRYVTEFGFNEFTDLNTVKNDADWFLKDYLVKKGRNRAGDNQYDIEFNKSNGEHVYLLRKSRIGNSNLIKSADEILIEEDSDGKTYRYYGDGKTIMYELPEGVEVYKDSATGLEVLVIDDLRSDLFTLDLINKYVKLISYDIFNISPELLNDDFLNILVDSLYNNTAVRGYFKDILNGAEIVTDKEAELRKGTKAHRYITYKNFVKSLNNIFKVDNTNYLLLLKLNNPLVTAMRRKHTSFLKSLDIVAARIPSQSLQSFMPMRVVAYDNPNRNSAYVSNLQILLLGSDFILYSDIKCLFPF